VCGYDIGDGWIRAKDEVAVFKCGSALQTVTPYAGLTRERSSNAAGMLFGRLATKLTLTLQFGHVGISTRITTRDAHSHPVQFGSVLGKNIPISNAAETLPT
jgi:hypothetical protein